MCKERSGDAGQNRIVHALERSVTSGKIRTLDEAKLREGQVLARGVTLTTPKLQAPPSERAFSLQAARHPRSPGLRKNLNGVTRITANGSVKGLNRLANAHFGGGRNAPGTSIRRFRYRHYHLGVGAGHVICRVLLSIGATSLHWNDDDFDVPADAVSPALFQTSRPSLYPVHPQRSEGAARSGSRTITHFIGTRCFANISTCRENASGRFKPSGQASWSMRNATTC